MRKVVAFTLQDKRKVQGPVLISVSKVLREKGWITIFNLQKVCGNENNAGERSFGNKN